MSPSPKSPLAVEWVALGSVFPNPSNPRINDDAVPHVAASIRRFGWQQPLVVKASGEIIAGHTRFKAAQELGLESVPIVRFEGTDLDAVAFGVADNRTHEFAKWDEPALAKLLRELRTEDALDGVGFSPDEIDALIAEVDAAGFGGENDIDDPGPQEPPKVPASRTGDLWQLGDHRLLCGDSTKADDVARVLAGAHAELLSTDPPYCVDYTGNDRPIHDGKPSGKDWSAVYREVDIKDLGEFLDGVLSACLPHTMASAPIYMWHAHVQQPVIAAVFERHDLLLHQVLVWVKPSATFGHAFYRWKHEPCAFGWKRGNKPAHGFGAMETVWEVDWEGKGRVVGNEHPCLHPRSMILTERGHRAIASIKVGDKVLAADGRFHAVAATTSHRYRSSHLFRVVAKGGNVPTLATDNHPFLVWRPAPHQPIAAGTPAWVRADELTVGDRLMTPEVDATKSTLPACLTRVSYQGVAFALRAVQAIARVPYVGNVINLSVEGNPTFQTAVGMSHNTQKPLRLFEIPMEQHTKPGAIVLEPFSGSGSQLLAAEKLGRRCRAIEISPAFVDADIRRFEKATGKKAIHEESGKTYAEVCAERGVVIEAAPATDTAAATDGAS